MDKIEAGAIRKEATMKIEKEVEEGAKETMKKGSTMTIIEEEEEAEGDKILIDQHHHKINLETNQNKEV